MINIFDIFYTSIAILENLQFLLIINTIFFVLKFGIFCKLASLKIKKEITAHRDCTLLMVILACYMIQDLTWIFHLARVLWFPDSDYRPYLFIMRITWGLVALQYQALSLFIENMVSENKSLNRRQIVSMAISACFFLFAVCLAIGDFNCLHQDSRSLLEFYVRSAESYFTLLIVTIPSLLFVIHKIRSGNLPRILNKQITVLISALIVPIWVSDLLQTFPLTFSPGWTTNNYSAVGISTILLTLAVYYSARKVIAFRFLNFNRHVKSLARFNFIDEFTGVLEKLSHASSYPELGHITQTLFKQAFTIPLNKTSLYIRKSDWSGNHSDTFPSHKTIVLVEGFLSQHTQQTCEQLRSLKILIHDEIEFNAFHEPNELNRSLLHFLDTINADIFLPLYEKNNLIAYIIVDRYAQPNKFYGNAERDEMLVFASYLGNIINLLKTRNLKLLLHQEKELKKELYHKHQEVNQYKESIRSFLREAPHKEIGIIFYKNRQFVFGNKAAKDLITLNVNTQQGHPLSKALRSIGKQVDEFKSPASCFASDGAGGKLVLSGVPNLEHNNVIIMVYRPEISDLVKQQVDALKNPTEWDYLLYLETTKSGKLINQLIPSAGQALLNFKIDLMKTALSNKAILLYMPEEDLIPTVEILHHISLRETLHSITLKSVPQHHEMAIKLFGINPLFGMTSEERPLLEKLDKNGTLFIQNIDLLDLESQNNLAEFLKYGLYKQCKSDQRLTSNARIICSTHKNLLTLVQENLFSKELFEQLQETTLSMPSLLTISEHEFGNLADSLTEQALKTTEFNTLLELTDRDKLALITKRPASLAELRDKIQVLLTKKTKESNIFTEAPLDPAYQLTDPQLIEAARLGKHALKDPRMITMLWNKFKSQSKIASFLGVNRSSVNRRCKDFNLI